MLLGVNDDEYSLCVTRRIPRRLDDDRVAEEDPLMLFSPHAADHLECLRVPDLAVAS